MFWFQSALFQSYHSSQSLYRNVSIYLTAWRGKEKWPRGHTTSSKNPQWEGKLGLYSFNPFPSLLCHRHSWVVLYFHWKRISANSKVASSSTGNISSIIPVCSGVPSKSKWKSQTNSDDLPSNKIRILFFTQSHEIFIYDFFFKILNGEITLKLFNG